jgi:hypothetical protein
LKRLCMVLFPPLPSHCHGRFEELNQIETSGDFRM